VLVHLRWNEQQLKLLADAHLISRRSSGCELSVAVWFGDHTCTSSCETLYEFTRDVPDSIPLIPESMNVTNDRHQYNFLFLANEQFKLDLIKDWQQRMHPEEVNLLLCAVCAQHFKSDKIEEVDLRSIDLKLLRNSALPHMVLPNSYVMDAFDGAILYSKALRSTDRYTSGDVCWLRFETLQAAKMPENALANFQYYADDRLSIAVANAFEKASLFDLMLVARVRMTKISYLFNHKMGGADDTHQGFIRGNIAVLPQDTMKLQDVIPPATDDV
jgi:hypothetical protein